MAVRWGLCCQFADDSVHFRQATHRYVATLEAGRARAYLRDVVRANAIALAHAVARCDELAIGAFRISSQILPLVTHPVSGYTLDSLDDPSAVRRSFVAAGDLARKLGIRLSFHPDQFVVLNSTREDVVRASVRELDAQAELADWRAVSTGCRNPRGRDSPLRTTIDCLRCATSPILRTHQHAAGLRRPPSPVQSRRLGRRGATVLATETWHGVEPWMHIATARDGMHAPNPRPHADFIDAPDFPAEWLDRTITVDVAAKAKDAAIVKLRTALFGARPGRPTAQSRAKARRVAR